MVLIESQKPSPFGGFPFINERSFIKGILGKFPEMKGFLTFDQYHFVVSQYFYLKIDST